MNTLRALRSLVAIVILFQVLILTHELSHAIVANHFGNEVEQISVGIDIEPMYQTNLGNTKFTISPYLIGGYIESDLDQMSNYQLFFVALAGPVSNLAIGIIGLSIILTFGSQLKIETKLKHKVASIPQVWDVIRNSNANSNLVAWFEVYFLMNIGIGILNLIPLHPFDGGKIVRSSLLTLLPDSLSGPIDTGMMYLGMSMVFLILFSSLIPKKWL